MMKVTQNATFNQYIYQNKTRIDKLMLMDEPQEDDQIRSNVEFSHNAKMLLAAAQRNDRTAIVVEAEKQPVDVAPDGLILNHPTLKSATIQTKPGTIFQYDANPYANLSRRYSMATLKSKDFVASDETMQQLAPQVQSQRPDLNTVLSAMQIKKGTTQARFESHTELQNYFKTQRKYDRDGNLDPTYKTGDFDGSRYRFNTKMEQSNVSLSLTTKAGNTIDLNITISDHHEKAEMVVVNNRGEMRHHRELDHNFFTPTLKRSISVSFNADKTLSDDEQKKLHVFLDELNATAYNFHEHMSVERPSLNKLTTLMEQGNFAKSSLSFSTFDGTHVLALEQKGDQSTDMAIVQSRDPLAALRHIDVPDVQWGGETYSKTGDASRDGIVFLNDIGGLNQNKRAMVVDHYASNQDKHRLNFSEQLRTWKKFTPPTTA